MVTTTIKNANQETASDIEFTETRIQWLLEQQGICSSREALANIKTELEEEREHLARLKNKIAEEKAQAAADARQFYNAVYEGGGSSEFIWC